MKIDNNRTPQKKSLLDRLIDLAWKDPAKMIPHQQRPRSPAQKFEYVLPSSFIRAVDEARLKAGNDILPRFRRSAESKTKKPTSESRQRANRPAAKAVTISKH